MKADDALLNLAARHHWLVTAEIAQAAGLSPQRWRRRRDCAEWIAVAPGVWRHRATPLSWEMQLRAGLLSLGRDAALAGRTAAAWWGLDGFGPGPVEFVVPRRQRRGAHGVVVHTTERWEQADRCVHRGLPVTTVTRTIIDLAGQGCTAGELEEAIDSGVRLRRTSIPTLTRRMTALGGSGRAGVRTLQELLLDSGGESRLERRFLRLVRQAGLPRPACQVVHRREGGKVLRVDFQFSAERLVVEVSGRLGHTSDRDRQSDARRRNALQSDGWVVLEFTTADVLDDRDYVVDTVRQHVHVAP